MATPRALYLALDLAATPTLVGAVQRQRLAPDILEVMKIAARCPETMQQAQQSTGKKPEIIRQAAVLYLQNALFVPSGDSYRALGVNRDAPQDEIRLHMSWLMKWLHPDREHNEWESVFAERVLAAWDDLKSPSRRARYDLAFPARRGGKPSGTIRSRRPRSRVSWVRRIEPWWLAVPGSRLRIFAAIGIGVAVFAVLFVSVRP